MALPASVAGVKSPNPSVVSTTKLKYTKSATVGSSVCTKNCWSVRPLTPYSPSAKIRPNST